MNVAIIRLCLLVLIMSLVKFHQNLTLCCKNGFYEFQTGIFNSWKLNSTLIVSAMTSELVSNSFSHCLKFLTNVN